MLICNTLLRVSDHERLSTDDARVGENSASGTVVGSLTTSMKPPQAKFSPGAAPLDPAYMLVARDER